MRACVVRDILTICVVLSGPSIWAAAPVIRKIEPTAGCVNQKIRLIGENFKKTRSVDFIVGHTIRRAKFEVISTSEVEVTVPEFLRPQAEALILLQDQDSVAFTCPANEFIVRENSPRVPGPDQPSKFAVTHVIHGGALREASHATIIEDGGVVSSARRSPLILIKNGGILGQADKNRSLTVLHEPAARLGAELTVSNPRWSMNVVKEINIAEGVGPFVYRPVPKELGLDEAIAVPEITAITPNHITPGDIVTLKGKGFCGTTEVYLTSHTITSLGFQIVSDSELKVETPDSENFGRHELIVVNAKGLTVTRSSPALPDALPVNFTRRGPYLIHVAEGTVLTTEQTNQLHYNLFVVEAGGAIASRNCSGVFLVKDGGTIVDVTGEIFHEPNASVPKQDRNSRQVPKIQISRLHTVPQFSTAAPWKK